MPNPHQDIIDREKRSEDRRKQAEQAETDAAEALVRQQIAEAEAKAAEEAKREQLRPRVAEARMEIQPIIAKAREEIETLRKGAIQIEALIIDLEDRATTAGQLAKDDPAFALRFLATALTAFKKGKEEIKH